MEHITIPPPVKIALAFYNAQESLLKAFGDLHNTERLNREMQARKLFIQAWAKQMKGQVVRSRGMIGVLKGHINIHDGCLWMMVDSGDECSYYPIQSLRIMKQENI